MYRASAVEQVWFACPDVHTTRIPPKLICRTHDKWSERLLSALCDERVWFSAAAAECLAIALLDSDNTKI